jgi:hypothetical protein
VQPTVNDKNAVASRFSAGDYDATNLAEFFAELGNTRHMFESSAKSLLEAITGGNVETARSKRGKLPYLRQKRKASENFDFSVTLKEANALNLGYAWGIKPFIDDLVALTQSVEKLEAFLKHAEQRQGLVTRVGSSGTGKGTTQSTSATTLQGGLIPASIYAVQAWDWKYTLTGYYKYPAALPRNWMAELNLALLGHGANRPLSSAWATARLSFALDWFLPIGDWLSGLRVPSIYAPTLVGACESTKCRMTANVSLSPTSHPDSISGTSPVRTLKGTSTGYIEHVLYTRALIANPTTTGIPLPEVPTLGQLGRLAQLIYAIKSGSKVSTR